MTQKTTKKTTKSHKPSKPASASKAAPKRRRAAESKANGHASRSATRLAKYLKDNVLSLQAFADKVTNDEVSCTKSYVCMLKHGAAKPGRDLACRIEEVTKGTVPVKGWAA